MKAYRICWLAVCLPLALIGSTAAFVLAPATTAVFIAFAVAGTIMAVFVVNEAQSRNGRPGTRRRLVSKALFGGTTAGAFAGWAHMLGAGVFLLGFAVLVSSPCVVVIYGRRLRSRSTDAADQPNAGTRASAELEPVPDLDELTDEQLCRGWRASYAALRRQSSALHVTATVAERQRYLDEIERRNPSGFAAWLASGARAPGNPLPYLTRAQAPSHGIDWDELVRREDR